MMKNGVTVFFLFALFFSLSLKAHELEISFPAHDGLQINGALSYPQELKKKAFPAIVLIHGSGPADRNHFLPGVWSSNGKDIRLFKQLGEVLNASGFVVLRYDKRGYGKFGEDFVNLRYDPDTNAPIWDDPQLKTSTPDNLVKDIHSALKFLRKQKKVSLKDVYLLGISEGTIFAPRVAVEDGNIKGLVMMGNVARNLGDSIFYQMVTYFVKLAKNTVDENENDVIESVEALKFDSQEFPFSPKEFDLDSDGKATLKELKEFLVNQYDSAMEEFISGDENSNPGRNYYIQKFAEPPQYSYLSRYSGSALMLQGENDQQTPVEESLFLRSIILNNPFINFKYISYPGLGHGFSPAVGSNGLINTKGPLSKNVLDDLQKWVRDPF